MYRRDFLSAALALPAASVGTALWARAPGVFNTGGVAVHGFDVVAYFTVGRPVRGEPSHAVKWDGALWYFDSEDHRTAFEMNPRSYCPRYGGYCAYSMAQGYVRPTDPDAWTVDNGRLFLNVSTQVRDLWRQDIPGYVRKADSHWPAALR